MIISTHMDPNIEIISASITKMTGDALAWVVSEKVNNFVTVELSLSISRLHDCKEYYRRDKEGNTGLSRGWFLSNTRDVSIPAFFHGPGAPSVNQREITEMFLIVVRDIVPQYISRIEVTVQLIDFKEECIAKSSWERTKWI